MDFAAHVGQEVTLRDTFRAARAARKRYFWPALGGLLLVCVALLIIATTLFLGAAMAAVMLMSILDNVWAEVVTSAGIAPVAVLCFLAVFAFPMATGYLWSVVGTFGAQRPPLDAFSRGLSEPFTATLVLLGLVESLSSILALAVAAFLFTRMASLPLLQVLPWTTYTFAGQLVLLVEFCIVMSAVWMGVRLLFLLAPLFAMTEGRPRMRDCLRYNWRVLHSRFRQFLLVASLPAIVGVPVLILLDLTLTSASVLPGGLAGGGPIALAMMAAAATVFSLWFAVYYAFLQAAFFRAAYGYPLDVPKSTAASRSAEATQDRHDGRSGTQA